MPLTVEFPGGRRDLEVAPGRNLAMALGMADMHLDTRCNGAGTCHRCRIRLVSGTFLCDGRAVVPPAEVNACRTVMTSPAGVIAVPENSFAPAGSGAIDFDASGLESAEPVLAIDLGTTAVQAALIAGGRVVASGGAYNRQFRFGDNVASRIVAAESHLEELRQCAFDTVRGIVSGFPGLDAVRRIALAGNTVMDSLWHGIDPAPIGVLPFTPPVRVFPDGSGAGFGVDAPLLTLPAISGYVGGDLTAGLLVTRPGEGEMLIDIGTNCEMILCAPSGILCAAAAAGPAFEGAGVRSGSRAVPGAIDRLAWRNGGFELTTIGGLPPVGICGSAFVDFLAAARRNGLVNEFGRLAEFECEERLRFYRLAPGIAITEADIEQILKAKAAVAAGIRSLLEHAGMAIGELKRVYLAGGFARHLDLAAAQFTGMLPELAGGEYVVAGNTSLAGAARVAARPELMREALQWIDRPREVALNTIPAFETNYIDSLLLP